MAEIGREGNRIVRNAQLVDSFGVVLPAVEDSTRGSVKKPGCAASFTTSGRRFEAP